MKTDRAQHIVKMTKRWRMDGNPTPFMNTAEIMFMAQYQMAYVKHHHDAISDIDAIQRIAEGKSHDA